MELFLTLLSGIGWSIVYIELIRGGFKSKTYAMPLFALGLNIAWELIYSYHDLFISTPSVQGIVNLVWAALDLVIVVTYFKYGRQYFPENVQRFFIPYSVLVFITCFVIQFAFYFQFDSMAAAQYSAFAQNVTMSILFVNMLVTRKSAKGQSLLMAVAKWIGTLAPTLLMGVVRGFNIYIVLMGAVCTVFDLIYIGCLLKTKRVEE